MKRRKVGNILALALLAAVAQRPMHPYEMASALRGWGKERDMEIKWGSLYTVVRNLEKHGLLEAVGNVREGRRPERTVYQITEAGRAELVDWARELISTPELEFPRFRAGLSVLSTLPPHEVIELLTHRLELLEQERARLDESLAGYGRAVPRLFLIEGEYDLAVLDAEIEWVRSLLAELTSATFPDLEGWRAYHETGEIPPELAELAEGASASD